MTGRAVEVGPDNVVWVSDVEIANRTVLDALSEQYAHSPLVAELVRWSRTNQQRPDRIGGIFSRDAYLEPNATYDQIATAREALRDDIVGGAAETTEALVFSRASMFCEDEDEEDVWNQWAGDIDLDSRLREMWHTTFSDSQCVLLTLWGRRDYRVRGTADGGRPRRRTFKNLIVPTEVMVADTLKVVPIGTTLFNRERFAYVANRDEAVAFDRHLLARTGDLDLDRRPWWDTGAVDDDIVAQLVEARYRPDRIERQELAAAGFPTDHLYLLRDECVLRHTLTRPAWKRFADVRMRSVFGLLDLKQQLQQMDRTFMVGGTNWIVLVKLGSDATPASDRAIADLQANVTVLSKLPVMVGPHTLSVEIVTPKVDLVLQRDKYDTLDVRIAARLFQQFLATNRSETDPLKVGRVIAEGLESRRHLMRRSLERGLFRKMVAKNPTSFTEMPKLEYHPEQISLAFDANWASFLLDVYEVGDLSRGTLHNQFGLDQRKEATRRQREERDFDPVFKTFNPNSQPRPGPDGQPPAVDPTTRAGQRRAGRRGGRQGGASPGSGQGEPPRRIRRRSDPEGGTE